MTKKKVFLANMYTKLFLAVALFTGMLYIIRYDYNLRTQETWKLWKAESCLKCSVTSVITREEEEEETN